MTHLCPNSGLEFHIIQIAFKFEKLLLEAWWGMV